MRGGTVSVVADLDTCNGVLLLSFSVKVALLASRAGVLSLVVDTVLRREGRVYLGSMGSDFGKVFSTVRWLPFRCDIAVELPGFPAPNTGSPVLLLCDGVGGAWAV